MALVKIYKQGSGGGGGGGTAVILADSGTGSSVRCGVNSCASGNYSLAVGRCANACVYSFSNGYCSNANGFSTASGFKTSASSVYSYASGKCTTANQMYASASGYCTTASAQFATASGFITIASGCFSTASGYCTIASGKYSTSSGVQSITNSSYGYVPNGLYNVVCNATPSNANFGVVLNGNGNNTTGGVWDGTQWTTDPTFIESGQHSFIGNGFQNILRKAQSFATILNGNCNHIGNSVNCSNANFGVVLNGVGNNTTGGAYDGITWTTTPSVSDSGCFSFIGNGFQNIASGNYASVVNGIQNFAYGNHSLVNGVYSSANDYSFSFGAQVNATGEFSFGMGASSTASGNYSFAFGTSAIANNSYSTAIGLFATASGEFSTAFGSNVQSSGNYSFVYGSTSCDNTCNYAYVFGCNLTANLSCALSVNNLSIRNIPTSSAGLPSGAVWRSGTQLNIVP
jgi:hypothetical protein